MKTKIFLATMLILQAGATSILQAGQVSSPNEIQESALAGDTFETPFEMPSFPFYDTGNTCGFTDDYRVPLYGTTSAPDVVYHLFATTDTCVVVKVCTEGSYYDLRLFAFANEFSPPTIAIGVGAETDSCSSMTGLHFNAVAGTDYYIIVDAVVGNCGDYTIEVELRAAPGDILVDPLPSYIDAPWHISGESGTEWSGRGAYLIEGVEPENYTLTWNHVPGWLPPSPNPDIQLMEFTYLEFSGIYTQTVPIITAADDIPGDQGYRIGLQWERCGHDIQENSVLISGYEIYLRNDGTTSKSVEQRTEEKLAGWFFMGTVPAHGEAIYETIVDAPCLCLDGTNDCPSVYFVRAITSDPFVFFDSEPDSGCALDNLAPSAPTSPLLEGDLLSWDEPVDTDFDYFTVYGSDYEGFGAATLIDYAITPTLDLNGSTWAYYFVTATDFAGNESEAATWDAVSEVPHQAGTAFALHPNSPNPFNPRTTIAFELPESGAVRLTVFDASGRIVNVLLDGDMAVQGRNEIVWSGHDMAGRVVSAGVYFYRLEAGKYTQTKKMTLMK